MLSFGFTLHAATGLDASGQLQAVPAATKDGFSYVRLETGVQFRVGGITKNVIFYGPNLIRVNANLGQPHTKQPSLAVVAKPASVIFTIEESPAALTIIAEKLRITADKQSGGLTFLSSAGQELTRERIESPDTIKEVTISGEPTYEISHTFTLTPDESLYDLGQYNRPYMDYRGQNVLLVQTNIGTVVPFLVSTKRYGIL